MFNIMKHMRQIMFILCATLFFQSVAWALETKIMHPDDPSKEAVSIYFHGMWAVEGDDDWLVMKESEGAAESFYVRLELVKSSEPKLVAASIAKGAKLRHFMKYKEAFLWKDKDTAYLLVVPRGHNVAVIFSWEKGHKVDESGVPSLVDETVHKSTIAGKPILVN